jgi:protein phosphatase
MKQLKVSITSHSIAGTKPENQDACAYHIPDKQALEYKGITSVIADGVSACERAAEASSCCVNSFLSDYYSTPDSWRVEHCATKVISALNNWLYSQSIRNDEISSMLSTLSVIIIKSNTAHIFHVGDSRIYRYRQGVLTQLTKDHVLSLNKEKTYLSRAMGFDLKVNVDYQTFNLEVNDQFLMTTDGVHDYLNDTSLQNLMSAASTASDIVDKALDADSSDNISAMIVKIDQLPEKNIGEAFDELTERPVPPDLDKGMKINGFEIQ